MDGDALRTRERVLRAAEQAFAAEGSTVTLDRIARLAGLGAGTVHRHFPSKDNLVEAVLTRRIDALVARAERWSADADPGPAFFGFLDDVIASTADHRDLCDAALADRTWPRVAFAAAGRRFDQAVARLLRAAQRVGAVRAEVSAAEVRALLLGCAVMRQAHRDGGELNRRVLGTLRPAPDDVTEPAEFRNGWAACVVCGAVLRPAPTGRPARYCGPACRQRAHRRRAAVVPASAR